MLFYLGGMSKFLPNDSDFIITGWFYDSPNDSEYGRYPFGGYFEHDSDDGIQGRLTDADGLSRISGSMTTTTLAFKKTYYRRKKREERVYFYKFEKKNGLWVGGWAEEEIKTTFKDHNTALQAQCLTYRVMDAHRAMNKLRLR